MPFDNQSFELDVAAAGGPFAKLVTPAPATETDEVLRCLIEARKLIEKPEHWAKFDGGFETHSPKCAMNALGVANCNALLFNVPDYMKSFLPPGFLYVHDFNDHPTTTHADVLALFDRAIASRRSELERGA